MSLVGFAKIAELIMFQPNHDRLLLQHQYLDRFHFMTFEFQQVLTSKNQSNWKTGKKILEKIM